MISLIILEFLRILRTFEILRILRVFEILRILRIFKVLRILRISKMLRIFKILKINDIRIILRIFKILRTLSILEIFTILRILKILRVLRFTKNLRIKSNQRPRGSKFGKNQIKNEDILKNSQNCPPGDMEWKIFKNRRLICQDGPFVQIWWILEEKRRFSEKLA